MDAVTVTDLVRMMANRELKDHFPKRRVEPGADARAFQAEAGARARENRRPAVKVRDHGFSAFFST